MVQWVKLYLLFCALRADGTKLRVPLVTDKRIAQQMLKMIFSIGSNEQNRAFLMKWSWKRRNRFPNIIDDYEQRLRAKNDSKYYITCTKIWLLS